MCILCHIAHPSLYIAACQPYDTGIKTLVDCRQGSLSSLVFFSSMQHHHHVGKAEEWNSCTTTSCSAVHRLFTGVTVQDDRLKRFVPKKAFPQYKRGQREGGHGHHIKLLKGFFFLFFGTSNNCTEVCKSDKLRGLLSPLNANKLDAKIQKAHQRA